MSAIRAVKITGAVAMAAAACGAMPAVSGSAAPVFTGRLFYTIVGGPAKSAVYRYDGRHFTFTHKKVVASTPDGDGLLFVPGGDLIISSTGGGTTVWRVKPNTGRFRAANQPAGVSHMALDPSGRFFWATSEPGSLVKIPLHPFGRGKLVTLHGDDSNITGLAFVPHKHGYLAFYTVSGSGGGGSFGQLFLSSRRTKQRYSSLTAAHGITYDSYTGDLFLFGSNSVAQIDPLTERVVSQKSFDAPCGGGPTFDQGSADGKGHLLVASNDGHLLFVDVARTRRVGAASNFVACPQVEDSLDDTAPLAGLGSQQPRPTPPRRRPTPPRRRPAPPRFTG